ncbi:MAG: glycosyltransferase family 39 protein [Turicibacter sp.]
MPEFKIRNILLTLFSVIFIGAWGYLTLDTIIRPSTVFVQMNPLLVVSLGLVLLLVMYQIDKWFNKASSKLLIGISIGSFGIILLLQLFFFRYFQVTPSWDFGDVYRASLNSVESFSMLDSYFYIKYPNNTPLFFFFLLLMRLFSIFGITDFLSPLILVNLTIVFLSIVCLYVFIYRRYGLKRTTLFSLFAILITPFYTYIPIVYTDTLTMIFPILALLIYDIYTHTSSKMKYGWLILLGILLSVGVLAKANVLIILVGILIHYVMTNKIMKAIPFISVFIISIIVVNMTYQHFVMPHSPIEKDEMGYPMTHWIMMGLNKENDIRVGGYNDADANFTEGLKVQGLPNAQIKKQHLNLMMERLQNFGLSGLVDHVQAKLNFTWADGTYFAPEKLKRNPIEINDYQDYVFGDSKQVYVYLSQVVHVVVMFLILLSSFRIFKERSFETVMSITLFGVILFLLIWETRSRYIVLYIPMMLALASYGFESWVELIEKLKARILIK